MHRFWPPRIFFARVLVDVDLSTRLPDKILVKIWEHNFLVNIGYERLPKFCTGCCIISHDIVDYRRRGVVVRRNQEGMIIKANAQPTRTKYLRTRKIMLMEQKGTGGTKWETTAMLKLKGKGAGSPEGYQRTHWERRIRRHKKTLH